MSMSTVKSLLNVYAGLETWKGRHIYLRGFFFFETYCLSACMSEMLRSAKTGVTVLSPKSTRGHVVVSDQAWA